MRFTKEKELIEAYFKDTKMYKIKYLWWPVTIGGETRWLETATIEYKVKKEETVFFSTCYYWAPWEFVNK